MDKFVIRLKNNRDNICDREASSLKLLCESTNNFNTENLNLRETYDNTSSDSELDEANKVPRRKRNTYFVKPERVIISSQNYSWLDIKKDYYYCKVCDNKISGSKYHLKRHETTVLHKKYFKAASKSIKIKELLPIEDKNNQSFLVKEAELRLCCYVCEHNLSLSTLDVLPLLNTNIYPDSGIAKSVKLKRKKATNLIVSVLAPYFKTETVTVLKNIFFSLMIDETTDISTNKALVVLVRYFKDGYVWDRFLDLITVTEGTAASLFNSIKSLLDGYNIPYNNIIGFAADNASTMMGDIKGVQKKLREISPHIYVQGCSCHSLHLCASAATKKLPGTVEQLTRDIYNYFSHSSKRREALNEFRIFANEKPHKLLKPCQTRWLSLQGAVDRIILHWNSLTLYFQSEVLEENLPTAKLIWNALQGEEFKIYFLFISYVLEIINKLNIELQSGKPKTPILLNRVTSLHKPFLKCFIKKEVCQKMNFDTINIKNPTHYVEIDELYVGAKTDAYIKSGKISEQNKYNFGLRVLEFYVEFCEQLRSRFNFKDCHLIYAANFVPNVAKQGKVNSIAEFITLFPNITIDIEAANIEWQLLSEIDINYKNEDISDFWHHISIIKDSLGKFMFSNLMTIVATILSLPHSSAAAERILSELNNTKTAVRNRLSMTTCSAILQVKDKMKLLPSGSLEWRPDKKLLSHSKEMIQHDEAGEY